MKPLGWCIFGAAFILPLGYWLTPEAWPDTARAVVILVALGAWLVVCHHLTVDQLPDEKPDL